MVSIGRLLEDIKQSLDEQRGALSASLAEAETALAVAEAQLAEAKGQQRPQRAKVTMLNGYVDHMRGVALEAKEALTSFQEQNCEGLTNENVSAIVTHGC